MRGSGASSAESFCLTTYVEGRYRDLNHTLLTVQYEKNTIVSDDHSGSTVYQKLFLRFISCHEKILVWIRCQLSIPPLCTSSAVIREQWHRDAKVLTSRPRLAASGPWKKIYAQTEAHWSQDGPRPTQQLQIMRSRHDSLHCMWSQVEICRLRNNTAGWGQDLIKKNLYK